MIKSISSNGRYMTVNGGTPSSTYYQNGMPMAGMTRYYNNNLEVYDGSGWVQIGNSYATVGLTSEAEEILDWAREKRRQEEAMFPLPSDHPAVRIAKENLNRAKAEVMRAEEQLKATIILSKDEQTTS